MTSVNLLCLDRDTKIVYRAKPRNIRIRESRQMAKARLEIDRRGLDDADLLILYNYPVLAYGATWERARIEDIDGETIDITGLQWEPFDLTEADFDNLEEEFSVNVFQAIMLQNPQRSFEYDVLKKMLDILTPSMPNTSNNLKPNENEGGTTSA